VMGLGAAISSVARAEWLSRESLIVFASNYVFVIASSFLGLVSGHIVWRTQEQLYRARRVGRYRLQAPIGKGAMGEVWLAWDLSLRRSVALKILRAGDAANPAAVRRFEREAQAAAQLRDEHIVQIFDFGASDDGLYYIAMEYLPGMDLGTLVDRYGALPLPRVVNIGMQACLALEASHGAGIIHRDLKPHNLFMTRVGDDPDFVKLLDFGIVRFRVPTSATEHLTWTGMVVGTPAYLAPELWTGAEADERSDLYSLGVTLYFLATGESLFETRSVDELRALQLSRESPTLTLPDEGEISTALRALLLRCLAWRPEDRVQTARELYDALAALPSGAPWTRDNANAFWRTLDQERFAGSESRR
jgi:eukaryotic-like serine/threonine-protein kinase